MKANGGKKTIKVKARSIVKANLIGTLIWILGVAVLDVIVYLIFGEANITVSLIVISITGLFFRLLSSCHVIFCALTNRDIEIIDDKNSAEKSNQKDTINQQSQGNEHTKTEKYKKSDGKNASLGAFLLIIVGVGVTVLGIVNLRHELRIFSERSKIKSQGVGTIGTIIESERKYGFTGSRRKQYTYYLHTVRYDGFVKTFQRTSQIPAFASVPVVYLPEIPDKAIVGKTSESVSQLKNAKFYDIFSLGFGFIIYLLITAFGSGLVLLTIIHGVEAALKKYRN